MEKRILPELLAPAGSPLALDAAIEGGADAIYVGGLAFNARINAKNFTPEELRESIARAHAYGVKIYIAANTLIHDRELDEYLRAAEQAYLFGADALIVADLGAARELKKRIPIELHASTQVSGHNVEAAKLLAEVGFSRMVCAREMSREDIAHFCKNSPIEAEVFVHGALCVCHSGQCLFSSVVGGRSGNRGECAQPCRLPFKNEKGRDYYPLSLKDLSLATHLQELCDMGVASLKIEGRMKSPEYVRDVTRIWRRLLDEGRNASPEDMRELAKIFSRGGFSDGYYEKKINSSMLGVRSESDKKDSSALAPFSKIERKIPITLRASLKSSEPIRLTASTEGASVTVEGEIPQTAINAPLSRETVERNLSKLGGTAYALESIDIELDDGLMLPISSLNALRRAAIEKLAPGNCRSEEDLIESEHSFPKGKKQKSVSRHAVFYDASAIPAEAEDFFENIFIPLEDYANWGRDGFGVLMPEVVYDSEREKVAKMLKNAKEKGATAALVGNLGHISLVREAGLEIYGDFRLNIYNNSTVSALEELGVGRMLTSPELSLAQQRDIYGDTASFVYGRIPLMITEKCVGKEIGGCEVCKSGKAVLRDRRGVEFPVLQRFEHRSAIFNSVPIYMGDRADQLRAHGLAAQCFLFTTESKSEIARLIEDYKKGRAAQDKQYKRIR